MEDGVEGGVRHFWWSWTMVRVRLPSLPKGAAYSLCETQQSGVQGLRYGEARVNWSRVRPVVVQKGVDQLAFSDSAMTVRGSARDAVPREPGTAG